MEDLGFRLRLVFRQWVPTGFGLGFFLRQICEVRSVLVLVFRLQIYRSLDGCTPTADI